MVEVLLINPFLEVLADDPAGVSPVLSLGYLAAFLEEKKVKVAVLDIAAEGVAEARRVGSKMRYGLGEEEIARRVRAFNPKIVGITCVSTLHASEAHETARIVKKADPDILVVMGGAHPSAAPEEVLKDKNVDVVVCGEGEITLWEIVQRVRESKSLEGILGVAGNPPRPRVKDINELPFPARHLLPMDIYFRRTEKRRMPSKFFGRGRHFRQASRSVSYAMRDRVMTMITSRGCPGNCVYCAVRSVWGRMWRGRSPENVVDEIEVLMRDFGANEIHFLDDSISVDQKRLEAICDEIIRRKIDIRWTTPNGIAIWLLNKRLLLKMKKAGCYRLTFGLESGNKEVLQQFIGKRYDHDQAREAIKFCSRIGLWTVGTFIVGFPYETREQIEDTINFAISTDLDFAVFYIANPFPGTPLYHIFQKEGLLPEGGAKEIVRGCRTKYFSHEELKGLQAEAFSRFLHSRLGKPWRFVRKIRSLEDLLYTFRLGRSLAKIFFNQRLVKSKGIAALWK